MVLSTLTDDRVCPPIDDDEDVSNANAQLVFGRLCLLSNKLRRKVKSSLIRRLVIIGQLSRVGLEVRSVPFKFEWQN